MLSKGLVGLQGRSAGGLTMGAVLNMRPDLFNAAIMGVPFVDVVTTMMDESIPLTSIEQEEWGNPNVSVSLVIFSSCSWPDCITDNFISVCIKLVLNANTSAGAEQLIWCCGRCCRQKSSMDT